MPNDTVELNEDMTSEDIKSYAESVIQEVQQERQSERKSDAEIVTDIASVEETSVEDKSNRETAESSEDTGSESKVAKWVTDDVKAEAAAYGIDESDLSDFASREELERAFRLFDKTALDAGRKALAESDETKARNEKGQFVKKEPEASEEQAPKSGRYEVSLSKDLYDDEIINEFTRMRDHYESRLEALESHFAEEQGKAQEAQFDRFVDSLGHPDLFGTTGSESETELERRKDLHVAVTAQMIGLERLGRKTEWSKQLVDRVANMVFADELGKKRIKQQTQKMSRQSQLRMGGSPTKPQPPRDDPREEAERRYRELERG